MSLRRKAWLNCDGENPQNDRFCLASSDDHDIYERNVKRLRVLARAAGWRTVQGRDFCPSCVGANGTLQNQGGAQ